VNLYKIYSADFKSPFKSIWLLSFVCITWSFHPGTGDLQTFSIGLYWEAELNLISIYWDSGEWWTNGRRTRS